MSARSSSASDRSRWLTLAAVAVGVFMTTLDNTVVNVALPSIQRDLHLSLSGLAWVVNGYVLSFAVLLLTGGRLADTFGRRRLFLGGLAGFIVASVVAGLAPSEGALIAARVLQGAAAALMTPPTLAIISHTFTDERQRSTAIGIWAAVTAAAFAVGPLAGGVITANVHWTWIFFVNVPIGILGLLFGARFIPESRDPQADRRIDFAGVGLISGSLFSLTYALIKANDLGWGSTTILGLLAASAVMLAGFVAVERRVHAPMVDLSVLRSRRFTVANIIVLVFTLATFGVLLYTSLYLQDVVGEGPVAAGAALLPWVAMVIIFAPVVGAIGDRLPVQWLATAGLVLLGIAMLLFAGLGEHSTFLERMPALALGGLGGAMLSGLSNVAIGAVPVEQSGVASGVHNTFRETGGSFGIAIIGAVFATASSHDAASGATPAHAFVSGYSAGLTVGAIIVFAAAGLAATMLGDRPPALLRRVSRAVVPGARATAETPA